MSPSTKRTTHRSQKIKTFLLFSFRGLQNTLLNVIATDHEATDHAVNSAKSVLSDSIRCHVMSSTVQGSSA